jgi:hypothetical protein
MGEDIICVLENVGRINEVAFDVNTIPCHNLLDVEHVHQ